MIRTQKFPQGTWVTGVTFDGEIVTGRVIKDYLINVAVTTLDGRVVVLDDEVTRVPAN